MQEGNVQTFSALTRFLVNQTHALLADLSQSFGYTVFHTEGYMVNALVAFVEPLLDCALGTCRLQQFQLHLATAQEGGLHFLVFHYFSCITLQAQHVSEERQALFDALDGYAQMLNVRNLHSSFLIRYMCIFPAKVTISR